MTEFKQDKAIYLQMAERLCNDILTGRYPAGSRIPSVRELAVMLQVNTNTVVRTYDVLLQKDIIRTQRGLGYFVTETAREKIRTERCADFLQVRLPELFEQMRLLDIPISAVTTAWEQEQGRKDGNTPK